MSPARGGMPKRWRDSDMVTLIAKTCSSPVSGFLLIERRTVPKAPKKIKRRKEGREEKEEQDKEDR